MACPRPALAFHPNGGIVLSRDAALDQLRFFRLETGGAKPGDPLALRNGCLRRGLCPTNSFVRCSSSMVHADTPRAHGSWRCRFKRVQLLRGGSDLVASRVFSQARERSSTDIEGGLPCGASLCGAIGILWMVCRDFFCERPQWPTEGPMKIPKARAERTRVEQASCHISKPDISRYF